jgi:hypothetical protein
MTHFANKTLNNDSMKFNQTLFNSKSKERDTKSVTRKSDLNLVKKQLLHRDRDESPIKTEESIEEKKPIPQSITDKLWKKLKEIKNEALLGAKETILVK